MFEPELLTPDERAWMDAEIARINSLDPLEAARLAEWQSELERKLLDEPDSASAPRPAPPAIAERGRSFSFVVVGSGVGGLCMAARLLDAGYEDVVILEKGSDLGGTWHHNNYPGVACDVASYFYSFSFHPNPNWTQMFAPGREIKQYLSDFADHYRLRERTRFGETVTRCRRRDGKWHVETAGGDRFVADVLIPATGFLHIPRLPDIAGLDDFGGELLHSSRWHADDDVTGKRVGVIGTGSTCTQIVSQLVDKAVEVVVFQRTPQWIYPAPNDHYSPQRRTMLAGHPALMRELFRYFLEWFNQGFGNAVVGDRDAQKMFADACEANLASIADPDLRTALTPDYPVLCKRLIFSTTYYPALQRDNARLVTDRIERVEAAGVRTSDGTLHALDRLVVATGFDTHAYFRGLDIAVEGGPSLAEAWREGARSFDSVALAGFPNLFFVGGPYTTVGNLSTMTSAELQVGFIIALVDAMVADGHQAVMPRRDAEDAFVATMNEAMADTVWVSGCSSWYLDERGKVDIWTRRPIDFMEHMAAGPDLANYQAVEDERVVA